MSSYSGGRKAPNVSQYLANLNTISSPESLSPQNDRTFGLDDDMNLFTNTNFFDSDFPSLNNTDFASHSANTPSQQLDLNAAPGESFPNPGADFKFPDFDIDPRFSVPQDIRPAPAGGPLAQATASSSPASARPSTADAGNEHKRKLDAYLSASPSGNPQLAEETARVAAEEDKRRRNTAASARFRVKKKQREQALEKTSKEMTEKAGRLEARVQVLEMENKWLKGLIMEKTGGDGPDLGEMFRQFAENGTAGSRIAEDRKDGVGTA